MRGGRERKNVRAQECMVCVTNTRIIHRQLHRENSTNSFCKLVCARVKALNLVMRARTEQDECYTSTFQFIALSDGLWSEKTWLDKFLRLMKTLLCTSIKSPNRIRSIFRPLFLYQLFIRNSYLAMSTFCKIDLLIKKKKENIKNIFVCFSFELGWIKNSSCIEKMWIFCGIKE